jgi:hypothetical protein
MGLEHIRELELVENYSPSFVASTSNLFYVLKHGRFLEGAYYVAEEDGKYIASSGWNKYTDDTALILVRTYVLKEYRTQNLLSKLFMPSLLNDCENYEHVWATFNKYNKTMYNWFVRSAESEKHPPTLSMHWPEVFRKFEPIGMKIINHTEQYVAQLRK